MKSNTVKYSITQSVHNLPVLILPLLLDLNRRAILFAVLFILMVPTGYTQDSFDPPPQAPGIQAIESKAPIVLDGKLFGRCLATGTCCK